VREDDRVNPHIRSRLSDAVAALSDEELHERRWLRGVMMNEDEMDFDDAVLLVVDEFATPDPRELIGHVLVDERELAAFVHLSDALERLVTTIGKFGTFQDAVNSGKIWQECLDAAQTLRGLLHE
jgi:hypothetical protein